MSNYRWYLMPIEVVSRENKPDTEFPKYREFTSYNSTVIDKGRYNTSKESIEANEIDVSIPNWPDSSSERVYMVKGEDRLPILDTISSKSDVTEFESMVDAKVFYLNAFDIENGDISSQLFNVSKPDTNDLVQVFREMVFNEPNNDALRESFESTLNETIQPRLVISADKRELINDGSDTINIEITALDTDGVISSWSDDVVTSINGSDFTTSMSQGVGTETISTTKEAQTNIDVFVKSTGLASSNTITINVVNN